ncbi:hypothetical protein VNO78_23880 [Psophocarpus tetragonolobus]|uniref:RING-type E3 ubiquitin transferase n=1 Tax=Psophocarpus tetragonolobus TaxID=3891 RepID=A0AAN9S4F1_PSOTE
MSERDRRMLSFPAVHPCEGISPPTLVASLISLSQSICSYEPQEFQTQRHNARETIRQIGIVLMFLEELEDSALQIPSSAVLCLAELHFTFQKIHFLMQDCTLQAARLLMLAKSELVASQFRALIRAVATSLDVLPLHHFHLCADVTELTQLVTKQASKATFQLDPSDARLTNTLHSVLCHFSRGTEPDLISLHQILHYLQITTWTDCNTQIHFLQEEISLECRHRQDKQLPLLSSLVAFLSYCRGVIFQIIQDTQPRCTTPFNLTSVNPQDFRCPISLDLMTDPVTVSTGQTYDRASIQKWLKAGNSTCPKTGEKLTNTDLVPNTTLKRLIQHFCAHNGISLFNSCNHKNNTVAGSPAAAHAMQFLAWFLTRRLAFGTEEQKHKGAYEIRVLARTSIFNRGCLIEMGTVPPLLDLLSSANDKSTQENTISALLKLSKHPNGPKSIIESGSVNAILWVLKNGLTLEARQIAAATIFYLSSVKEYAESIGENPEVIPALVELVKEGRTCGRKNAVVAIFGLLSLPRNHQRVLAADAVPALLDILSSSSDKEQLIAEALAVLAALAENVEGARAILQGSALPLTVGMLRSATSRAAKEHSASILLSLCVNGGPEVVAVLAKDPSLMPLLYSLLAEAYSHAAKKARFLIKVIQDFHETRTSGLKGSSPPQEPSLHVW